MSNLYIGLMSGTSMDGVDVAVVDLSKITPRLLAFETRKYPDSLLAQLHSLCRPNENEIVDMGHADRSVSLCFAEAVNHVLHKCRIPAGQITAIGSHGQTIRHYPRGKTGFTLQIGDPNTLAVATGIDVIADFRRKDVALGGQGAPLAPGFHQAVFRHSHQDRVILNIGGMANITYLPKETSEQIIGFDTGPGNALLDGWCQRHKGQNYDKNGAWGATGVVDSQLLKAMLQDPYFSAPAPKSTGRERFDMAWVDRHLAEVDHTLSNESIQATLTMLTSHSIAMQIATLPNVDEVFVCGGGAHNEFLMECLESELINSTLLTTNAIGIAADAVEAIAFAWLAYAHNHNICGNIPSVTGASSPAILGGKYNAK